MRFFGPVVLGLAAALLLAPACELFDDDDDSGETIPFTSLAEVDCLAVLEPGTETFRSADDWEPFWLDHTICTDGSGDPLKPPPVDFATQMLLAVHWGAGYAGCSSSVEAIREIRRRDGRLEVQVGPLPDLGDCERVVHPIQVVRLERSEGPVVFLGAPAS